MQTAPKYSKIELIDNRDAEPIIHKDCGMFITGEKLVIVIDTNDSIQAQTISEGIVYDLNKIHSYKTYKK